MKRAFDLIVSLVLLAVLCVPIALLALCVKLGSRGPAIFRALRVGRSGRTFHMLKLRTMTACAGGPAIAVANDPRVTSLGRFLRRSHLDELPQLWNVAAGEMSLVGPRPEEPRFVDANAADWRRVLALRPGITGPSQLAFADEEQRLLGTNDPERDYRERVLPAKLRADLAYVEGRTFARDLAVLARTALHVLRAGR